VSLIFILVGAFAHPPPTLYLSARRGLSLSVIGRFRSPLLKCVRNELPGDVTASVSLTAFRRQLRTCFFVHLIRIHNLYGKPFRNCSFALSLTLRYENIASREMLGINLHS